MRYFSALCARMYRFSANSRATISSTAIFLSQQSRQYFSSPLGSETSLAPHSAHRDFTTDLRGGMSQSSNLPRILSKDRRPAPPISASSIGGSSPAHTSARHTPCPPAAPRSAAPPIESTL